MLVDTSVLLAAADNADPDYWRDRNERWFPYADAKPSSDLAPLLAEIDIDPTRIFWG